MELIVGLGEYVVTDREDDVIKTFALASCVAVTVYSPEKKAAGMIHVVLPSPLNNKDRRERPGYFAETGIPLLIKMICQKYGCAKEQLQVHMYGGADSVLRQDIYSVGRRNIGAAKHALLEMGLKIHKADLCGNESRTLTMEVKTGSVGVYRLPILR